MLTSLDNESLVPRDIFKMYDIRGIADDVLTEELMYKIGQSFGTAAQIKSVMEICVGRDGRISSPRLKDAIVNGIRSTGVNVVDIGMVPTPVLYFAAHRSDSRSGLMVTASHNPSEYNGVKLVLTGHPIFGSNIQKLRNRVVFEHFVSGDGAVREEYVTDSYEDSIVNDVKLNRGIRVVVDCANGVGGLVAPQVLERIGCDVIPLYCDVDGNFPNHEADPTKLDNLTDLISQVKANDADVGIAIDGDADRMVAVAPDGEMILPDRLMILFAQNILMTHPRRKVVYDVKCTRALKEAIETSNGLSVMWKTGHSLMKAKMADCNAIFGGEMSGHFFFADRWPGFDDGIYAAARLCELLANDQRRPQEIFSSLPKFVSTPEIRATCYQAEYLVEQFKSKVDFIDAEMNFLDGVRADFDCGFGLLRASNTAPELVFRFEADSDEGMQHIQGRFYEGVKSLNLRFQPPF